MSENSELSASKSKFGFNLMGFLKEFSSLAMVISLPLLVALHKLGFTSDNVKYPLAFSGDELLYATNVLSFYDFPPLKNSNFGAPVGQDLSYAYLSVDSGPIIIAALFAKLTGNVFFGLNLYYLLTFPLAGISGYLAARMLGIKRLISINSGLIIALVPFHFIWWTGGITITSYFILPCLFALTVLRLQNQLSRRQHILSMVTAFINGFFYSYYALGYLFIFGSLLSLLLISGAGFRKLNRILPMMACNLFGFLLVAIPALLARFQSTFVDYFSGRDLWAGIVNSTTPLHYILPYPGSVEDKFITAISQSSVTSVSAQLQSLLNSRGLFAEGWSGTIPLTLLVVFIFLVLLQWNNQNKEQLNSHSYTNQSIATLKSLTTLAFLWSVIGGFGFIFSALVTSILRGYARYSIFTIILLTLFVALSVSGMVKQLRDTSYPEAKGATEKGVYKTITVLILFFSTTFLLMANPPYIRAGNTVQIVESTKQVESLLEVPEGCSILQLPVMHYPYENPGYPTYPLLRFGLLSDRYKWSSGAVGGSPAFASLLPIKSRQSESVLSIIPIAKSLGFCGILIDVKVWETVSNFKPWPEYNSGVGSLNDYLAETDGKIRIQEIDSADGQFFWINLIE